MIAIVFNDLQNNAIFCDVVEGIFVVVQRHCRWSKVLRTFFGALNVPYRFRTTRRLFSSPTTATLPRTTRQLTTHSPPPRLTTSRRHSSLAPNTQLKHVIPPLLPHPPSQRIILLYLYNNHAFDQNVGKHCAKRTNNAYLVVAKRMYFI